MSSEFYVYENWRRDRGGIHRAECRYCNFGKGFQAEDGGKNGKWHGPYDRDTASTKANSLNRSGMKECSVCKP
ncbi:hypothetical protein [Pararhizobium arenae]|uniref:hypothetical protein n=1 Tax=Pararhizobium arenae TaxID=1856850 RepID=UPI00117BC4C3|nr:hypothetical protein [Pararhizobium arenae]